MDLTEICGQESADVKLNITGDDRKHLLNGTYSLAVGIENPDTGMPQVQLDMNAENMDGYFFLN